MRRTKDPAPLPGAVADPVMVQTIRLLPMQVVVVHSVTTGAEHRCLVTPAEDPNGEPVLLVLAVLYTDATGDRLGIGQQLRESLVLAP